MSKRPPDFSFERDGRSLSVWLRELVAEDASARLAAGEALQAMMFGVPSVHTDWAEIDWASSRGTAGQADRFKEAVRAAARTPGFPASDFVRRLIVHRIALKEDWHRRVDQACNRDEAPNPFEERLIRRLQAANDEAERVEATRRYARWLCASTARNCKRSEEIYAGAESMTAAGMMAAVVFDSLDEVLLADRPGLRAMLDDKAMFHDAAGALARIGPPARDFAGFFLDRLDAQATSYSFDGAHALGSIGRDDPDVIDALLKRLRSGPEPVRNGAAAALGHAGPPLAGRLEIALDLLLGATHAPALVGTATAALASVGRDREEALCRVLELAAPRPSRWRTVETHPDFPYDEVMHERGVAIEALTHFRRFAHRVVPVLADAFETFEEYDPDWGYDGEHGRTCWALRAFGPAAAPVVPRLVRYLDEWTSRPEEERDWPKDVIGLLASIGTPASAALTALERLRAGRVDEGETPSDTLDPDDPLDQAILALRGDLRVPS